MIRLDKYLADAGLGTRSKVKQIIKKKMIKVNGVTVSDSDFKVDTEKDIVLCGEKTLKYNKYEYFMLNKPAGVVSAVTDNKDKTVIDIINVPKRRDLFPVGRLDKDTEGLLLITNDGMLANRLLSPNHHVKKRYFAKVTGNVLGSVAELFKEGVDIGDDKLTAPAELEILNTYDENGTTYTDTEIVITEGRYHQIKRMFLAAGHEVVYLKRLQMGTVFLDESLKTGEFRTLTEEETDKLYQCIK